MVQIANEEFEILLIEKKTSLFRTLHLIESILVILSIEITVYCRHTRAFAQPLILVDIFPSLFPRLSNHLWVI